MSTSRRRTRFTVLLAGDNVPKVVLTYSADDARYYYAKRGQTVVKVTRGDYRKKARAREAAKSGGFTINQAALREAKEILGLKWPVQVRTHARHGSVNGNYRCELTGGGDYYHNIMIKSYLTPEQATKTLWHELTHAMQAEREGSYAGWVLKHEQEHKRYSYRVRPIEIEAREMSDMMAPTHSLTR